MYLYPVMGTSLAGLILEPTMALGHSSSLLDICASQPDPYCIHAGCRFWLGAVMLVWDDCVIISVFYSNPYGR